MPDVQRSAFSDASQRQLLHGGCGGFLVPDHGLTCAKCHRVIADAREIAGHPPIEIESTQSFGWARISEDGEL